MRHALTVCVVVLQLVRSSNAADPSSDGLAASLRALNPNVLRKEGDDEQNRRVQRMLHDDVRARRDAANRKDRDDWKAIQSRADWEKFRDERIDLLRKSLGRFPTDADKGDLKFRSLKAIRGDGYQVENVVFESRPGLIVTANLYSPAEPKSAMPGILICHSHHRPKIDGELQDMGMNFARAGCVVLVPDQLGHGERRQHPFATEKDFDAPYRVSRQDYFFRYNVGMQLHLVGESLVGWMAWDMIRGIDLLLSRPGIDKGKIILMGAVAGGGDPTAVTAALDARIAAVVPFNFGGPQPENTFPLPADAELSFNMFGGGSWESTRNLKRSVGDGFPPWVIVGSVAPRRLIYAHEFAWDREHDPVWKRLEKVFSWYDAADNLAFTHGYGRVSLPATEASHCNHIGTTHRKLIWPALERWFGIPAPKEEYRGRLDANELLCLSSPGGSEIRLIPVHQHAKLIASERSEAFRTRAGLPITMHDSSEADRLRAAWAQRLGSIEPTKSPEVSKKEPEDRDGTHVERLSLRIERAIDVPLLLCFPTARPGAKSPVVVAFGQGGKSAFLQQRGERIAELLKAGAVVCLVDVRGTGETSVGSYRGRQSDATGNSSSELMQGQTLVGSQLKDLRTVLAYLRTRNDVNPRKIALWGDSFAATNTAETRFALPLEIDPQPKQPEPLGHLLALLGGLFEPDVAAIASARGGLVSLTSVLDNQFPLLPHDAVVPGCLEIGDLDDVSAAIVPLPQWLAGLVNETNRPAEQPGQEGQRSLLPRATHKALGANAPGSITIRPTMEPGPELTAWLIERLK